MEMEDLAAVVTEDADDDGVVKSKGNEKTKPCCISPSF